MNSLVLELQKEASRGEAKISELLRQAYIVARKLNMKEFEEWISSELNGYTGDYEDIPAYRIVYGDTRGMNPYTGAWIPIQMEHDEIDEMLHSRKLNDSAPGLEALLKADSKEFTLGFNNYVRRKLSVWSGYNTNFSFFFNRTQVETILEKVRTIVLEWSLKLEEEGILGKEMIFDESEKAKADSISNTNNYFFGNINGSQLQLNSINSTQSIDSNITDFKELKGILKLIKENLNEVKVDSENQKEVENNIETLEKAMSSGKVKESVIIECLSSIRNVMEGITGSLIASGIIHQISQFLSP